MKLLARTIGVVALGLATGCMTVRSATSPGAHLGRYQTYAFAAPEKQTDDQAGFEHSPQGQVVRNEIARSMAERGFKQVAPGQGADLVIAFRSVMEEKVDVTGWGGTYGYGYGYGYGPGWGGLWADAYTQGTITIDLIDPRTNLVVWRGTASAVVNHPENPDPSRVAKAVDKVMRESPVFAARPGPTVM